MVAVPGAPEEGDGGHSSWEFVSPLTAFSSRVRPTRACDDVGMAEPARMAEPPPAFAVNAGDGEPLRFGGADFLIKASAETTGGSFSIVEEIDPLDTPLHVHQNEDELFFVLEGEHVFQVGEEEFPGDRATWSSRLGASRTPSGGWFRAPGGCWS